MLAQQENEESPQTNIEGETVESETEAKPDAKAEEDVASLMSKVKSLSQLTGLTSKTFISNLQKQLNEEKEARQRLEEELKQLKQISKEIANHLKTNPRARQLI